jgi:hypothetical protein
MYVGVRASERRAGKRVSRLKVRDGNRANAFWTVRTAMLRKWVSRILASVAWFYLSGMGRSVRRRGR